METKRGSWGSTFGFLMAAIGSAVGLGNIWGFPYKMGKSGGFTFLLVYIALGVFVGFIIMASELALGRKTGLGAVGAYHKMGGRFKWIGWLAVLSPFLIMTFYAVLGGYTIQYMSLNLAELSFGIQSAFGIELSGANTFGAMLTNPFGCIIFTLVFMIICYLINRVGVSEGVEKFNTIGMPALFVMLIIVILRAVTMDGAVEGLKFMFVPGYAVEAGFVEEAPSLISVLGTAGGQMFFSLSLAMGAMITYGSYLGKKENLKRSSVVIVMSDTVVALMAGLAVIPAAVANGIQNGIPVNEIQLGGPKLLFVTLQNVFAEMGVVGPLFGVIFYGLVLIAAISSAISLVEVVAAFFLDNAHIKGRQGNRKKTVFWVCIAIMAFASLVAACGLGENHITPADLLGLTGTDAYAMWNDCWLDFMDFLSEGFAMPLGAMLMALMVGWEKKPETMLGEIETGSGASRTFRLFYTFCIKILVPIAMCFILAGQLIDFFTPYSGAYSVKTICYAFSAALLVIFFIIAVIPQKKTAGVK